jgi:hypothetical protein
MELIPGPIPAPQVQERRKASLLTSAIPGPALGGVDWGKGVVAWPESAPSYRVVQDCTDEMAEYGDETEFGPVGARPFVIQTVTKCPRGSLSELRERALRHIRAISSQAIAYELWTGEATALDPWTLPTGQVALANPRPAASGTADTGPYLNPYLTAATLLSDTYTDATQAMGAVEAAVAERMAGGPVYLHTPTDFVMGMGADLSPVGDLLQTPTGSIVVADAGYPGTDTTPVAGEFAIYGTGPVTVWLGEPTVYDESSWVVDHDYNRVAIWAERPVLVWFDPQTLVGANVSIA